jgi:hypothetical protein
MRSRLLYDHQAARSSREEQRAFRLFMLAQLVHYGGLLVLLLGGIALILFGLRALLT